MLVQDSVVGLQRDREREERVKNKGKTSNRCMTVFRALLLSVLSVAVMVPVMNGLEGKEGDVEYCVCIMWLNLNSHVKVT